MHGRKKTGQPPSASELESVNKKILTYNTFVSILFERRKLNDLNEETLMLTSKMLSSSPDFYTIWNFRREVIMNLYGSRFGVDLQSIPEEKVPCSISQVLGPMYLSIYLP